MSSVSQLGARLLADVKSTPGLLPYQDETVRGILGDIALLHGGITDALRGPGADESAAQAVTVVQAASLRRLKRTVLAYHPARCDRIEALGWTAGAGPHAPQRGRASQGSWG